MNIKKPIKATFSGVGTSLLSTIGLCVGGGACGLACFAPITSVLGISISGISILNSTLLPLMTALSAIAFTIGYFSLYKNLQKTCCEDQSEKSDNQRRKSLLKPIFWAGVVLSIFFYAKAMASNEAPKAENAASCMSKSTCQQKTTDKCG